MRGAGEELSIGERVAFYRRRRGMSQALLAGLILGMIQAATSINEQTLSFVPKLVVVAFSIMVFGGLILGLLSDFTVGVFERIPDLVK